MSPHVLASGGVIYQPSQGLFGSATLNDVGKRYLDIANTARAAGYLTTDARVGYRWSRYEFSIYGENLSNRRAPVTASEFGGQSFYRLPGRRVFVDLTVRL